jgi:threonine dehydrogenase-like Zn-dependent dehydrogenase
MMIDPVAGRLEIGASMGAETMPWSDDVIETAREWAGGEGSEVVFDATGAPDAIRAGFETAVSAGRLVMVGMSHHDVPLRVFGFVDKELDVLGVSCCKGDEFEEAVGFVERNGDKLENLITQEFPLDRAPEALRWAMDHPSEAMKVVIGDIN